MNLFLCSHFSSVGSLIKEEIENKKVAFIPTASLREGYTGYVGSAGTSAAGSTGTGSMSVTSAVLSVVSTAAVTSGSSFFLGIG